MTTDITADSIQDLLSFFAKSNYHASAAQPDSFEQTVINNCTAILKLDYNILEINNSRGDLSGQYPSSLLIPESDKSVSTQTIYEHAIDAKKLRSLCKEAKSARCRTRFPIPVMIFRGKYICRSSTLSGSPEALGRAGIEAIGNFIGMARGLINGTPPEADEEPEEDLNTESSSDQPASVDLNLDSNTVDALRAHDINLVKYLNISTIVDLMVENKKVKYGFYVTSSEKVDKQNRYAAFRLACLPYPGCEFFKKFRERGYGTANLHYDWAQSYNDAKIHVPPIVPTFGTEHPEIFTTNPCMVSQPSTTHTYNCSSFAPNSNANGSCAASHSILVQPQSKCISNTSSYSNGTIVANSFENSFQNSSKASSASATNTSPPKASSASATNTSPPKTCSAGQQPLNLNWNDYQKWDLQDITLNYLQLLLHYIKDSNGGLLVHCISGWDRTPLFVSLLRISLWADGAIHQTLTAIQLLYYTLAYDWYMFGHNLPDRLKKGEDIFFFCFYMLKHIEGIEYSTVNSKTSRSKHNSSSSSIGVIRTDSDQGTASDNGMMFEVDSSRGSNMSINSIGCYPHDLPEERRCRSHLDSTNSYCSNSSVDDANGSVESLFTELQISSNIIEQEVNPSADCASDLKCSDIPENKTLSAAQSENLRRTSPVSVPMSGRTQRMRNESMSSVGNSWQMISAMGSLRSPEPPYMAQNLTKDTITNGDAEDDAVRDILLARRIKLDAVRMLFYKFYWATIGRDFPPENQPNSILSSMMGRVQNLAF